MSGRWRHSLAAEWVAMRRMANACSADNTRFRSTDASRAWDAPAPSVAEPKLASCGCCVTRFTVPPGSLRTPSAAPGPRSTSTLSMKARTNG